MYTKMTSSGSSLIVNSRTISRELESKIAASIAGVIRSHDVCKLTTKLVRQAVEKEVRVSLTNHKEVLKRLMHQELRKLKAKKAAQRAAPEPWKYALRRKSILKGLNCVYHMGRNSSNFPSWGLHAIQSLYDLQAVESVDILRQSALYARLFGALWLKADRHADWAVGTIPTPTQLVHAIAAIHVIERLGISHARRVELLDFCSQSPPVYGASDLLGWDPAESTPSVAYKAGASIYELLTSALVLWHHAHALGISLGYTLPQLLQHLLLVYPYKGPGDLSPQVYEDQVHFVTSLVLVLTNQGRLRCETELLPHEYFFLRHNIIYHLAHQDVALLGETMRALRCFEGSDDLVQVRRGMAYLLLTQREDGSWATEGTQNDPQQCYFMTMQAVWALSEPQRLGFAPAFLEATPILELHLNADIHNPGNIPVESSDGSAIDGNERDVSIEVAAATAAALSVNEDVATQVAFLQGVLNQNGNVKNVSAALAIHILSTLADMVLTVDILKSTGVGRTINKLRKHATTTVAKAATQLVAKWKKDLL